MKIIALSVLGAAAALTLTACGGSSSNGYTGTAAQQGDSAGTTSARGLHVASTSLGRVVVDGQGRTVYLLTADSAGHATCDASCQSYWPPVPTGHGAGVTAKVASTPLPGGGSTETVGGQPVYTYSGDQAAGDVSGEGVNEFGGTWYAVSPSGTPVMPGGAASSSSSPAYTGHGY
jgi:predicted lipoprotein with Yx(FWY)xxD motif